MKLRRLIPLAAALFIAGCQTSPDGADDAIQLAILGDNPYAPESFPRYEKMIDQINADPGIDVVVHVGDMKDGGTPCTDEAFADMKAMNDQFRVPFVLTPGDNDWFDCRRESAGGYDRRERLAKIRELFYSERVSLPLVTQPETGRFPDFVENVYWLDGDVMFATLHVIGVSGTEGGMDIHAELLEAAIDWLDTVFEAAASQQVAGVFLAMQADPYPFSGERGWIKSLCPGGCPDVRSGYEPLHEAFIRHAKGFRKPILLAVGDTHVFRVDKPLYAGDTLIEHFTRVEPFGEDEVHWVRVTVDARTPQVFTIQQQLVPANLHQLD